jgi:predicted nuclease with TOPRIM domain
MNMHNSLRAQLGEVFDTKQADVLANVVTEAYDKLVTKSDLYELRVVVREIADNQKITDERLAKLAENTERRFAQTDGRIDRMADSIDRLAGRTEQLAVGQERLFASQEQLTGRIDQLAVGQEKLTGRMEQLAGRVDQLAISQDKLTGRMEHLAGRVDQLAISQDKLTGTMEQLTGRMDQLAVGQDKLTGRMEQLAIGQEKLTCRMDQLTISQEKLTNQVRKLAIGQDELVGPVYEGKVAAHLYAYVGDTVDHCVVLDSRGKARFFANLDPNGTLEPSEISDLRRADIFATGRIDGEAVVLVVEVSRTSDEYDITRTARRAAILAKTGTRAIPVVACLHIGPATRALARSQGVWVIRKGRLLSQAS